MTNYNKNLIISGGSRGIGKDIINYYLKKNFKILCISRKKPLIRNKNLSYLKIDFFQINEIIKNKKKIINFNPKYLINNAAIMGEANTFLKSNLKNWKKSFNVNLFSHIYLTKILLNKLINNKGKIIFMAGGGGANAFPKFSSYSVAKTALVRFVENLAEENKKKLDCYVISPGPVKTKLLSNFLKNGHKIDKSKLIKSDKCIKLINFLFETKNNILNGRYIHSLDDYLKINKNNIKNDYYLRRTESFKKK